MLAHEKNSSPPSFLLLMNHVRAELRAMSEEIIKKIELKLNPTIQSSNASDDIHSTSGYKPNNRNN